MSTFRFCVAVHLSEWLVSSQSLPRSPKPVASRSRHPARSSLRSPGQSSLPKQLVRTPPEQVESESPTATALAPSLCARFADTKSRPRTSSRRLPSSASSARLPRNSRPIFVSRVALSLLSRCVCVLVKCVRVRGSARSHVCACVGGIRGLSRRSLRGHEPVRHPCQARHHSPQGHSARPSHSWRANLGDASL